jgi:ribosomal protein L16 Arg81 hydroxylase
MAVTVFQEQGSVFSDACKARFEDAYPLEPANMIHTLANHPLLSFDALAEAAKRMDPAHVECRVASRNEEGTFDHLPTTSINKSELIRSIETSACWIMLRFVNQLPEYRALVCEIMSDLRPQIEATTGPVRDPLAFVFVSSAQSITPFHFDPEYNILFQIRGKKSFSLSRPVAPFVTEAAHDRLHRNGDNLLESNEDFEKAASTYLLMPGDALFVPYKAPHRVCVADEPSISISVTWKSDWSLECDEGHRFNALARRLGLHPKALGEWPARHAAKALISKTARRFGVEP